MKSVPVEVFRDQFEQTGLPAAVVARRLGWYAGGIPDGHRVYRVLGIRPYHCGHSYGPRFRTRVRLRTALRLAGALGLDPVDIDQ